jgi:hypothetical protein
MNIEKNKLVTEIVEWVENELVAASRGDPLIKNAFKFNKSNKVTDYFWQVDSLRLRSTGFKIMCLYFTHQEFLHDRPFNVGEIITLSKHLNSPFFINERKITIFNDEQIVMCSIAGSVATWIKNLS